MRLSYKNPKLTSVTLMYKLIFAQQFLKYIFLIIILNAYTKIILKIKDLIYNLVRNIFIVLIFLILFLDTSKGESKTLVPINTEIKIDQKLAFKYCEAIDKKFFEGLDNELILKYEYLFSSISKDSIDNMDQFLENFSYQVKSICSYELSENNKKEFNMFFDKFHNDKNKW
tara:strand:- start:10657 stop:11169 length:513 start_codon:yes stop_codon:yes gene_type:complete